MTLSQEDIVRALMSDRVRLAAAIHLIVRDTHIAEDIFQNVTVKALAGKATFEHPAQLFSWARITARHEALNWLRDHRGRTCVLDETVLDLLAEDEAARPGAAPAEIDALRACLSTLPTEARDLLEQRYGDNRSCGELARAHHLRLDALYQRLSRLHRALKSCIDRRLAGEGA